MKKLKKIMFLGGLSLFVLLVDTSLISCSDDDEKNSPTTQLGDCYVHLFDGDNFKGDNIIVAGPGEFPNLDNLPGSTKNWSDEADSFKSGENTRVVMWTEFNFQGDSVVYEGATEMASVDEPFSMKIYCQ